MGMGKLVINHNNKSKHLARSCW